MHALVEELVSEVTIGFVPAADPSEKLGLQPRFHQVSHAPLRSGSRLSAAVNFIHKRLSTAGPPTVEAAGRP